MKIIMNIKLARFFNYLLTVKKDDRVGYSNIFDLKCKYDYFIGRILLHLAGSEIMNVDTVKWLGNIMNTKDMNELSEEDKYKLHMSGDLWVCGESDTNIEKIKDTIKTIFIYSFNELNNELTFDSSDDYVEWDNQLKYNSIPLCFMQLYLENNLMIKLKPKFVLNRDMDIGYTIIEEEIHDNLKLIKEIIELNIETERYDDRRNILKEFLNR